MTGFTSRLRPVFQLLDWIFLPSPEMREYMNVLVKCFGPR